jgi:hypothetical protein
LLWGRDQAGQPVRGPDKNANRPVWGERVGGFFKKLLPDRNT